MKTSLLSPVALLMLASLVSAAEPDVLFKDTFDKKPGDGWTWLREHKDAWRIKDGGLEIRVEPGVANTVKNALLRKAPDRSKTKFAVEVTITFNEEPTQQYEQAGITWYHGKKPVFKLVHEHIDGKDWIIPGRKPAPSKTVQLRLVVDGTQWTAQFREDLKGEFQTAASGQLPPPGDDQLSIQCYNGPPQAEHWIRFDDFRIVELRDTAAPRQ
jgi:regulation of enolase protein 1 (concanavalin A-like superfamily)